MRSWEVVETAAFAGDLEDAVAYYVEQAGKSAASRFLGEYDKMVGLLESTPGYGAKVHGSAYRWRPLGVFTAIYAVDDAAGTVTLHRLYYMSSNWKARLLDGGEPEGR